MEHQQLVKNITKPILKISLTVLFLCCLLDMPYGYFQLVGLVGMTGFIVLAYLDKEKEDKTIMIIWICSAVLINPIFKLALGRTIWNIVAVIWSIILLTTLIIEYNADRRKNHS
jgi:hypothetical protein